MAENSADSLSFSQKHYFLIRRLHSLSGIVPLAVFLVIHLVTNASILGASDGSEFQKSVERIHSLGWLLVPAEIFGIFLPLLFHTLVGFQIAFMGRPNAQIYGHQSNVRYTLQRVTAYIAFVFILFHVYQMHWLGAYLGGGQFRVGESAASTARAMQGDAGVWIAIIYAVGILATVFHCANGIWTALITWGITIKPEAQRAAGYVCAIFGVMLAGAGLGALFGFMTFDLSKLDAPIPRTHADGAKPHTRLAAEDDSPGGHPPELFEK